jgi:hypothetical protein
MQILPAAALAASPGVPLPSRRAGVAPPPVSPGVEAAAFTRFALAEGATVAALVLVLATAFVV